jgi:hypothetical protein
MKLLLKIYLIKVSNKNEKLKSIFIVKIILQLNLRLNQRYL